MNPPFDFDPRKAVAHLQATDPRLSKLIHRVGPFRMEASTVKNIFEALMESIIYQQLHGRAAATIHTRVRTELRRHHRNPLTALDHATDQSLRAAGLSANKFRAIRDLAAKARDGTVPTLRAAKKMTDGELISRLTSVRGIGPWTVHMLLIFHLRRPDILPTGDFAVRLAFKKLYNKRKDPTPESMIKHARAWQPYRSVASWYLWRSLDLPESDVAAVP